MLVENLQKKNHPQYKNSHQLSEPVEKKARPSSNDETHNEFIDIDNAEKVKVYFQEIMGRNEGKKTVEKNAGTKEQRGSVEKDKSAIKKEEIECYDKRGEIENFINVGKIKENPVKSESKRKTEEKNIRKFNINVLSVKREPALSHNVNQEEQSRLIQSRTSVAEKREVLDKMSSEFSLKKRERNERIKEEKSTLFEQELERAKEEKKRKVYSRLEEQKAKQQQDKENNNKVNKIKEKKFIHEKLEQKYNTEVMNQSLEERKKKLKEIRNQNKVYTMEEVNKFEKDYMKKKEAHHDNESKENSEWIFKAPEKPQKLSQMLEEENIESKLKLEEKKKRLEEKIQKQTEFLAHLKLLNPMVSLKTNRSEENLNFSKIEQRPMPEIKSIGNSYLEETKKRKREVIPQTEEMRNHSSLNNDGTAKKEQKANYFACNKSEQEYSRIRDKRIEKIIESSEIDNVSKIIQLRTEAERLEEEQKRIEMKQRYHKNPTSEDGDKSIILLLASIKAKMGIIDLYTKN